MVRISADEIETIFESLASRPAKGEIQAHELRFRGFYIAVSEQGDYLCLLKSNDLQPSPSRRLRYLSVDYGLRLRAEFDGEVISGAFTVIRLAQRNADLLGTFSTLLEFLLSSLGDYPTSSELEDFVEAFIELFTSRKGEPRERIKGLFGELALIRYAPDPNQFAAAWHDKAQSNKDFSLAACYVEVKTTEGQERKHRIGARQIETLSLQKPIYLASVSIEQDPRGISVFQLLAEVQDLVAPESQTKMVNLVFETIGLDVEEARELKWSTPRGAESILLFNAEDLPRPRTEGLGPSGAAITAISFDLNLDVLIANDVGHQVLPEFEA